MDNESDNFDLEPGPRNTVSKYTLAALCAVGAVLVLVALDVALIGGAQAKPPRPIVQVTKLSGTARVEPVVYLSVTPGIKPGPDGQLHDAYSVTDFVVHAGKPIKLVINNTDTVAHSINSPGAGVTIVVRPGTHSYTLLVSKTGHFEWYCMMPCDPFSMAHVGYMRGYITST